MQCFTCEFVVMDGQPRGMGVCWKDQELDRKPKDVLIVHNCKKWKLGPMHHVLSRSKRRKVFDENGIVQLK